MKDYEDTVRYIKDNLIEIADYAMMVRSSQTFQQELLGYGDDLTDFDYWDAYGDRVDLNFYCGDGTNIVCLAYPVVNGVPDYSEKYKVRVDELDEEYFSL